MTETSGPNRMSALIEAKIAELGDQRERVGPGDERRDLNRLIHQNKSLLKCCRTRTGYRIEAEPILTDDVEPIGDTA